MSAEKVIAAEHPRDGREWDNQCARCGSSMQFVDCDNCGGDGLDGHDCGEDTCCCLDPDDNEDCDWCQGSGGHWACLSSAEWCEAHPVEGREETKRGTVEWFTFDAPRAVSAPGGPGTGTPWVMNSLPPWRQALLGVLMLGWVLLNDNDNDKDEAEP